MLFDLAGQARQFHFLVDQVSHGHQHFHVTHQLRGGERSLCRVVEPGGAFQLGQLGQEAAVGFQPLPVSATALGQQYVQRLARGDIHFSTNVPYRHDDPLEPFDIAGSGFVNAVAGRLWPWLVHDRFATVAASPTRQWRNTLPDLLADVGHHRVGQAQDRFQHAYQGATGAAFGFCTGAFIPQYWLGELQVPVAVLVPDELIERLGSVVKAELFQGFCHLGFGLLQTRDDPAVGQ